MRISSKHIYFYITIFAIAIFGIVLNSTYDHAYIFAGSGSEGDPYTVCAAACDYTTISDAMQAVGANDYVEVQGSYNTSTESWPISLPYSGVTLTCASQSVVIGPTTTNANQGFQMPSSSAIVGCTLDATNNDEGNFIVSYEGGNNDNWELRNNIIINHEIQLGTSSAALSNTLIDSSFAYTNPTTTVASSSITMSTATSSIFAFGGTSGHTIASNTISYNTTSTVSAGNGIFNGSNNGETNDITITSNAISVASTTDGVTFWSFYNLGRNFLFSSNTVYHSGPDIDNNIMTLYGRTNATSSLVIQGNSFFVSNMYGVGGWRGYIAIEDDTDNNSGPMFATFTHNIYYYDGRGYATSTQAFTISHSVTGSVFFEDYNGYAGYVTNPAYEYQGTVYGGDITSGGNSQHTVSSSPFRDNNASGSDDFVLNPFSTFLDIYGTVDIGAVSGVRGSTFTIDDDGTIDYSTVHGTSTADIMGNIRSGDTWNLAEGTYSPFSISSSTMATSSITIDGAGGGNTIINGTSAYTYGMLISELTNVTIQDLVIQNASTTLSTYTMTNPIFTYDGTDYEDSGSIGATPAQSFVFTSNSTCNLEAVITILSLDPSTYISGSHDWHLALVDIGGLGNAKVGVYVPNQIVTSPTVIETLCSDYTVIVDKWVTSTFSNTDGVLTYIGQGAMTAEGVTMKSGYSDPPTVSYVQTSDAGLKISSSTNVTVTNLLSTQNGYGVHFSGDTTSSTINNVTISNSTIYDVYSDSTGSSSLRNTSFDTASSSINAAGNVDVYYKTRAFVTSTDGAMGGVGVTFTRADSGTVVNATTTATGYTPYISDDLLAFIMTSSSIATDNGGYNPWTVLAAATSTYSATSTATTLNTQNQIATLVYVVGIPTAPSDLTVVNAASTTMLLSWTDNSSDETSFLFDFVTGTDEGDFPSLNISSVASSTSSITQEGLTPNTQYTFHVAAVGTAGTSTYSTAVSQYTSSTAPSTPSAVATSDTSMTITWTANTNGTGTVYELYNVTDSAVVATTTEVTYAVTGLTAETAYQFKVRAENLGASSTYSDYSADSIAVSTDAAPVVSSGSSGSIPISFRPPQLPEGVDAMNGALQINNNATTTESRAVTLTILAGGVSHMAVSNDSEFTDVSFVPFTRELSHTLSEGSGTKKVYVKIRTPQGGTVTITDTIALMGQETVQPVEESLAANCPVISGLAYKTDDSPHIYFVTDSCTRRPFNGPEVFFSYFVRFESTVVISSDMMESIPLDTRGFMTWGPLYDPITGSLIKIPEDPKVYFLVGGVIFHIEDEDAAKYQFGIRWKSWIDTVAERVQAKYIQSDVVLGVEKRADGVVVKYRYAPERYVLETNEEGVQEKRLITDDLTMYLLGYRTDRIVTIPITEIYPNGKRF